MAKEQTLRKPAMKNGDRNSYTSHHSEAHSSFIPRQKKFCCCRALDSDETSYSSRSDFASTSTSDESWTSKFSFGQKSHLSISTDDTSHDFVSSRKSDTSRAFPSVTLNESVDETRPGHDFRFPHNIPSIDNTQEEWEHEDQSDSLLFSPVEYSLQSEPKDSEINLSTSSSDYNSIKSDSLVFQHLKELLSELNIPDNQSPEYHVSWAFEPRFSKPKPSERFENILIEMNHFQKTGQIMGNDLNFRIQKLRLESQLQLRSGPSGLVHVQPIVMIRNSWSLVRSEFKPPWKTFGPTKALNSVTFLTVTAIN